MAIGQGAERGGQPWQHIVLVEARITVREVERGPEISGQSGDEDDAEEVSDLAGVVGKLTGDPDRNAGGGAYRNAPNRAGVDPLQRLQPALLQLGENVLQLR